MFYVLNFRKHTFCSSNTLEEAKNAVLNAKMSGCSTDSEIEVLDAFDDELRCTGAEFLKKNGFVCETAETTSFHIRAVEAQEFPYCTSFSGQVQMISGLVATYLVDYDKENHDSFLCLCRVHDHDRMTELFQKEMDSAMAALKSERLQEVLVNSWRMSSACSSLQALCVEKNGNKAYGLRADTEHFSIMMRLEPWAEGYKAYLYAYEKKWLDRHLEKTKGGIRFITSDYKELFRLPDGGTVTIIRPDGKESTMTCWFLDEYHFETGGRTYHICEFAEMMERNHNTLTPETVVEQKDRVSWRG